jgi:membrane protein implicated in regulation of membrane protease activity
MRIRALPFGLTPTTLALISAVAFVIAFISAGIALLSMLFALAGSAALGLLFYVLARRFMMRRVARQRSQDRLHSA